MCGDGGALPAMQKFDSRGRPTGPSLRRFLGLGPRSAEQARQRQSHLLALRDALKLLMPPRLSEADLLQQFCQLVLEQGVAQLACIARPDAEDRLDVLALAGSRAVFVDMPFSSHPSSPGGTTPLALAWREQRPFYSNPLFSSPPIQAWQRRLAGTGLHSTAVLPLTRRGQPWALLTLLQREEEGWPSDSQLLLESIAHALCTTLDDWENETHQGILGAGLMAAYESVVLTDAQRRVLYVNQSFQLMTGYGLEEMSRHGLRVLQGPDTDIHELAIIDHALREGQAYSGTILNYRRNGEPFWNHLSIVPVRDREGRIGHYVGIQRDISAEKDLMMQLEYESRHDTLTGLVNRRALEEDLGAVMARVDRYGTRLAAYMIDLDHFKPINDLFGHEAGDHVLRVVAHRLRDSLRRTDYVARLGGDEFVLLLEGFGTVTDLEQIFIKLEMAISEAIVLRNQKVVGVRLSMGVCLYPEHGAGDAGELLRFADQALYHSKARKEVRKRYWSYCNEITPGKTRTNTKTSGISQGTPS
jgi:diguanylate cyclase (GGDEF)-like protein/PAS domain S-box-containing protein